MNSVRSNCWALQLNSMLLFPIFFYWIQGWNVGLFPQILNHRDSLKSLDGGWSGRMLLSRVVHLELEAQIRATWLDLLQPNTEVIKRKQVHTSCVSSKHICRQNGLFAVRNRHIRNVKNLSAARAKCYFSSKCVENGASLLKGIQRFFQRGEPTTAASREARRQVGAINQRWYNRSLIIGDYIWIS